MVRHCCGLYKCFDPGTRFSAFGRDMTSRSGYSKGYSVMWTGVGPGKRPGKRIVSMIALLGQQSGLLRYIVDKKGKCQGECSTSWRFVQVVTVGVRSGEH